MLNEAQSAQHIVLDRSLIDMLNVLGNCEKDVHNLHLSQENHIKMINDLENHRITKEQQVNQLNSSLQKGETETSKLSTELSEYKETLDRCIEACKREIEKKEETLKGIKEKMMDKQNLVDILTNQFGSLECTYDKKFKEIDDKLVEHDEQMADCVKEIDKMKKTYYHTDDKSGKIGSVLRCCLRFMFQISNGRLGLIKGVIVNGLEIKVQILVSGQHGQELE